MVMDAELYSKHSFGNGGTNLILYDPLGGTPRIDNVFGVDCTGAISIGPLPGLNFVNKGGQVSWILHLYCVARSPPFLGRAVVIWVRIS
jgi:hypothetical protein